MAFNQTSYPVDAAASSTLLVSGRWSAPGGTGNLTKLAGRGISSVNYNSATGKYIITFSNVGATFLGCFFSVLNVTDTAAAAKVVNSVAYSASAKTLTVDVTALGNPPALSNFANGDVFEIMAVWADTSVP